MKIAIVIPARFKSSRFPGKPLANILGKPLIIWVAQLCENAIGKKNVYIATDDSSIANVVERHGFKKIMTSSNCLTGTDRVAEASNKIDAEIIINVQGDEPLVDPEDIKKIIKEKKNNPNAVICGYSKITAPEKPEDLNICKVIFNENNNLIYASRAPLPGSKDHINKPKNYFKQVCIYAFNRNELEKFFNYSRKSYLESFEDIEIIRFLEWGQEVRMIETSSSSIAVDNPEDILKVENFIKNINA